MEGSPERDGAEGAVAVAVDQAGEIQGPATETRCSTTLEPIGDPRTGSGPRPGRGPAVRSTRSRLALLTGLSQVVSSHVVLGVAGVCTLPVLARNFGPAAYGDFSLFVTVLGVVAYQDFARQLLVHEQANNTHDPADLNALARMSTGAIAALAAVVGLVILPPVGALLLTAAALLHGLASRDWAALSYAGRVGTALALRNCAWALAFTMVTVLSFTATGPGVYAGPFVLANLAILIGYRILASGERRGSAAPKSPRTGSPLRRSSAWTHLRRAPSWPHYRREISNLFGFTVASSVMVCADRVLLEKTAAGATFGHYVGHADLAVKMHILSTALASALYPMLARTVAEEGPERAARRFVSISTWAVLAYFVAACVLIVFEREVVGLILGADFLEGPRFYSVMMVGIFVQVFGYLITPWQRSRGDFATQRKAYNRAAILMVVVGLILIPTLGAVGALVAYMASRVAEVQLFVHEVRRLPRDVLPRWKVGIVLVMVAVLSLLAALQFTGGAA